jgi:hypothetical protein
MVLSTTKKTSSICSITNQTQGGGMKKMGLSPQVGVTNWVHSAYSQRGSINQLSYLQKDRFTMFPNQNLPVGFRSSITMH